MANQFYNDPRSLRIEDKQVVIRAGRLKHGIKRDLRNFFNKYGLDRETGMLDDIDIPAGLIEDKVIRMGLVSMSVAGEDIPFVSTSPVDDFPEIGMGDDENDIDLYTEVLKTIVDKNRFLANQYPFGMVFAQYSGMVDDDKRDQQKKEAEEKNEQPPKEEVAASEKNPDEVSPNPLNTENEDTSTVERISGSQLSATTS